MWWAISQTVGYGDRYPITPDVSRGAEPTPCVVTVPAAGDSCGTEDLSVWLRRDGTIVFRPGGPGFVLPDGALAMKFPWERGVRGQLTIKGHRLDGSAPPLRANIRRGYGISGYVNHFPHAARITRWPFRSRPC
jgi:hypothetical protein